MISGERYVVRSETRFHLFRATFRGLARSDSAHTFQGHPGFLDTQFFGHSHEETFVEGTFVDAHISLGTTIQASWWASNRTRTLPCSYRVGLWNRAGTLAL